MATKPKEEVIICIDEYNALYVIGDNLNDAYQTFCDSYNDDANTEELTFYRATKLRINTKRVISLTEVK